ncbi:hypothetical protein FACS18942_05190 [Planctomycetales bacterium]|nr:hypothetical protein FACS18942_05190 [Planctomycetales bacterium]
MSLATLNVTVPADGIITLPSEFRGQDIQIVIGKSERDVNPEEMPELTEDEIVAICKQVRKELRHKRPELYAPN